jgi:hypothetical protein
LVSDSSGRALDGVSVQIASYQPARGEPKFPVESFGDPRPVARSFRLRALAPGTYGLRFVREWNDGESGGMEENSLDGIEVHAGGVARGVHVMMGGATPAEEDEPSTGEAPAEDTPAEEAPSDTEASGTGDDATATD